MKSFVFQENYRDHFISLILHVSKTKGTKCTTSAHCNKHDKCFITVKLLEE